MTTVIVPTNADVRWGQGAHCFYDYYRNGFGFSGARNPCLFVRHAGGGVGGSYIFERSIAATGRIPAFFRWLVEFDHPVHFDYISFESGQSRYDPGTIPRANQMIFPEAVVDVQRAICEIKKQHHSFNFHAGFDPSRCVGFGDSHGATLMGLASVYPPMRGSGGDDNTQRGVFSAGTHDSTLRGMIYHLGQIDVRFGTDVAPASDYMSYFNMAGWWGIRDDDPAEFNALPASVRAQASLRAFIQSGDTRFYRKMFTMYQHTTFAGYPLTNSHDSQQRLDLNAALDAAKLPYDTAEYNATDFDVTYPFTGPVDPSSTVGKNYQKLYDFLVSCIS